MSRALPASEVQKLLRAKGHARHVPGEMNNTERAYEGFLKMRQEKGEIKWYAFEMLTFKLAHDMRYTPDFVFMDDRDELVCVDVKGRTKNKTTGLSEPWIMEDALIKLKVAARVVPMRFVIQWPMAGGMTWGLREVAA